MIGVAFGSGSLTAGNSSSIGVGMNDRITGSSNSSSALIERHSSHNFTLGDTTSNLFVVTMSAGGNSSNIAVGMNDSITGSSSSSGSRHNFTLRDTTSNLFAVTMSAGSGINHQGRSYSSYNIITGENCGSILSAGQDSGTGFTA